MVSWVVFNLRGLSIFLWLFGQMSVVRPGSQMSKDLGKLQK